jgi:DNA modification methylase
MIIIGDCIERMRELDAGSVDTVVTDPPYGLAFMGHKWDSFTPRGFQEFSETWGREALRVAKPGAMLLSFAGTRTYHRMAAGIEDAGWIVRDLITWNYGSGFPKSHDISKGMDRRRDDRDEVLEVTEWIREARDAAGVTNAEIDRAFGFNGMAGHWTAMGSQAAVPTIEQVPALIGLLGINAPPDRIGWLLFELNGRKGEPGKTWADREKIGRRTDGCGNTEGSLHKSIGFAASRSAEFDITAPATALAKTWEGYGTALKPSIEPILVAMKPLDGTFAENAERQGVAGFWIDGGRIPCDPITTIQTPSQRAGEVYGKDQRTREVFTSHDAGRWPANSIFDAEAGAILNLQAGEEVSRFFYCPKPGKEEKDAGVVVDPKHKPLWSSGTKYAGSFQSEGTDRTARNHHATVKPVDLMRYLVRLTRTPTGGVVLDPFMGSGTTGVACKLERREFVGIEMSEEYAEIARQRIAHHAHPDDEDYTGRDEEGQMELFS